MMMKELEELHTKLVLRINNGGHPKEVQYLSQALLNITHAIAVLSSIPNTMGSSSS